MGKRLILIRHAKAEWNSATQPDFDRPLHRRGHANAAEMAERLAGQRIVPDKLVSSPALRAFTTAKYFAEAWGIAEKEIAPDQRIYEATVKDLLGVVNAFDNRYMMVALFGHNPGISNFAGYLSDTSCYEMPTCGIVIFDFAVNDWAMVSAGTATVSLFDSPEEE